MNKNYVKPSITVVDVETETLLGTFSGEGNGGVSVTPKYPPVTSGDADAKPDGENNSGDIWDDEW